MSDKGGSDLDVFDGLLSKKAPPPSEPTASARAPMPPLPMASVPPPPPGKPGAAPPPSRLKTLLGLPVAPPPSKNGAAGPFAPPSLAPPLPSSHGAPLAPPPSFGAQPPASRGAPLPPPPSFGAPLAPPVSHGAPLPPPSVPLAPLSSGHHPPPAPVGLGSAALPTPPPPPQPAFPPPPAAPALPHLAAPPSSNKASGSLPGLPGTAPKAGMDIDWDDDDEKTAIFDKAGDELPTSAPRAPVPAAGAPAASSPTLRAQSAPAASPVSKPAASAPAPKAVAAQPAVVLAAEPKAAAPSKASGGSKSFVGLLLAAAAAAIVALVYLYLPKVGTIDVSVTDAANKEIDSVQIFVDGAKWMKCETSPCLIQDQKAGEHKIKVIASGFASSPTMTIQVAANKSTQVPFRLGAAAEGSGLKVSAEGTGLKLWVDGKEVGPLPQEIKGITPGEHQVRIAGNDRYEAYEEKVTVAADQPKVVGPIALKVLKGLATIETGTNADGAKIQLVSGTEKRVLAKLPIKLDIPVSKAYHLVATKKGFVDLDMPLAFDAGKAEKTFTVQMLKVGEAPSTTEPAAVAVAPMPAATPDEPAVKPEPKPEAPARHAATPGRDPRLERLTGGTPAAAGPSEAAAAPAAGQGKLNINSIPVSNVILDGRPLGPTPKLAIATSAGAHTVVFVHPEHGRKQIVVTVIPGQTQTAAVRFP